MEYMTFTNRIHILWVSQFVHTKGHILHKQLSLSLLLVILDASQSFFYEDSSNDDQPANPLTEDAHKLLYSGAPAGLTEFIECFNFP